MKKLFLPFLLALCLIGSDAIASDPITDASNGTSFGFSAAADVAFAIQSSTVLTDSYEAIFGSGMAASIPSGGLPGGVAPQIVAVFTFFAEPAASTPNSDVVTFLTELDKLDNISFSDDFLVDLGSQQFKIEFSEGDAVVPGIPLDGGLSLLALGGIAFGIRRFKLRG
jgi:hypothetical protein